MKMKRFTNDLRHLFEAHHILSHDIKDTQRLRLINGEKTGEVDAREIPQEEEGGGSGQAHNMQIARTEAELEFQSQRTRLADERRAKQLGIAEGETRDIVRQVVMGGSTLVTYGAGLDVQHVVCGYESCFLTIKNLPRNVQQSEVEELFTQLGVDRNLFYIVEMRQVNNEVRAKVLSDSEVGHAIAVGLTGIEFRDGHYLDITVGNGPTPRLDINVLTVAWTLPSSIMVAQYSTEDAALNALNRLNNTMFRRRKIRAELYRASGDLSVGHSIPTPSIKISGLPLNVTTAEVEEYSDANLAWTLTVLPGHDLTHIVEQIRGFEGYEVNLPNPNRFNAEVRFQFTTWDDAKRAQNSLEGCILSLGYPPLHGWLPMPIQYITTIPLPQYHAQKGLWDSMPVEKDNDKSAFVRVINNETDKTYILVLGEDKKAVGQLKVRVENLLAGEALDWRLWHRSFMDASGRRFLDGIRARTKAYVRVDSMSKILKLYADRDVRQTVIDLVEVQITRLQLSGWSIPIPLSTAEFFIRKGLPTLKEELGEDAATLELPIPRLIIRRGGEEAHRNVDRLIEESLSGIEYEAYDGEKECPSCFGKASSPVFLSCGHLYCAGCLRHFLSSAAQGKAFPLVCFGNEDKCGAPIAIPVIRRLLLQQQFDQLAEAAVKAYIETQPAKFKYCATPGCMQSYRCREDSWTLTCPSCFAAVCSSCHKEAHDGMTCREKRMMDSQEGQERLNEEWARGAGAKRCPSCRIWIQKTEGCNHMSCRCGAHICWNCLATFSEANDVYNHLRTVHGGMHADNVQPALHLVPRAILNHDDIRVQRQGWQWIELGHRGDLNFACEEDGHLQGQAGRQPQPDTGRRWLPSGKTGFDNPELKHL